MKERFKKEMQKMTLLKECGYDIGRSREFILQKAQLPRGSVLEIGTGNGHFTLCLAKAGFSLTSIDLDPAAQKLARAYLKGDGLEKKAGFKVMNAEKLEFTGHSFDSVVSVNFLHHADNPLRCLREIVRVARSSIVIADVNKKGAAILERLHQRQGHGHPRSRISFPALKAFLQEKGFRVKTFKGFCQTVIVAEKTPLLQNYSR